MAIVSDVEIRLRADIARLQQDLNRARQEVNGALGGMSRAVEQFKTVLGGIAFAAVAQQIGQFVKSSIDAVDALNDMSARTKVAITDLAGLAYGAKLSDTSLEGVADSITKLGQNIGKDGDKFRALGITAKEPLEAYKQLADIFKDIQDPQQRAAFGAEALGKSWQASAVLLDSGSEGIAKLIAEGKELSGVTDQVAADAGKFNDKLDELGFAAKGLGTRLVAGLLPTLNQIAESMSTDSVKGKELEGVIAVLSGAFKGLYTVGVGLVEVFTTLGKAIGAAAAMTVQVLSGDFAGAWETYKNLGADIADDWVSAATRVSMAWTTTGTGVVEAVTEWEETVGGTNAKVAAFLADTAKKAADEKAKSATEALKWYEKTRKSSTDQLMVLEAEREGQAALSAEEKKRLEILNDLLKFSKNLTPQQRADIRGWAEAIPVLAKYNEELEKTRSLRKQRETEAQSDVAASKAQAQALQDQITYYGLTEEAVLKLKAAEIQRGIDGGYIDDLELERLEGLLAATNEQIQLQGKLSKMKSESTFWTGLEDTAKQTFLSIANGSKDTATRLKETFKNIFFDWLYQMTVKKWIINIGTSISGGSAVSGIADVVGGGSSGAGSLASLSQLFSSGSSLMTIGKTIFTGFSTGLVGSLGSSITSLGTLLGSEAVAAFGAGVSGGALGATTASAASGYGGTAAAGYGATAGSGAVSAIPIIGWIIAGMTAANAFMKQGFTPNNGTITNPIFEAISSPTNMTYKLLDKLGVGKTLANIISGAAINTKLFGRADPRVESQGIRGTISTSGIDAETYANILAKGGVFRSDKRWTDKAGLSTEADKLFDATITGMVSTVKGFSEALGIQASVIDGYAKSFDIKLTGDATKDNEALAALFSTVGDELSLRLVPSLKTFAAEGETLSATLQRLVADYVTVDAAFKAIGKSISQVGVAGIEVREQLIKAAGGLEQLATGISYFQQNFIPEAERVAQAQKEVTEAMTALGYSGVTTTGQFKDLVQGLDVSTKAGAELFAKLLALAPAFKEVSDATDAARKAAIAALAQAANDALAALGSSIDKQKAELAKSLASALDVVGKSIETMATKVDNLRDLSELMSTTVVAATTPAQQRDRQASARADILAALAIAKASGVLPSADSLRDAVSAATSASTEGFGDMVSYLREQASVGRDLAELGGITNGQLTVAEKTLQVLNDQKTAIQAGYDAEVARLDALLATNKELLAAAQGNTTTNLSVASALAQVAQAIGLLAIANGQPAAAVEALYQSVLGRQSDSTGLAYWIGKLAEGSTLESIRNDFLKSPEYLSQQALASTESPIVAELRAMNTRMAAIEESTLRTASATDSSATSNAQLAQQFDQVSAGGGALLMEPV